MNWAHAYGITPLMAAANLGNTQLVQYLVDHGGDLGMYDLGSGSTARSWQALSL